MAKSDPHTIRIHALLGIPLINKADNLCQLILDAIEANKLILKDGSILVLAQKIVSKAEDRFVNLKTIKPTALAIEYSVKTDKDPRLVELILQESKSVIRHRKGVLVVENHQGLIMANAGIDHSNVEQDPENDWVLLLPEKPDKSAASLHNELLRKTGCKIGVIINDSIGRAWRNGTIGTAIGVAGLSSIVDLRGQADLFGNQLRVSEEAIADELASAASLMQGQADEGLPVVLIEGYHTSSQHIPASELIRPEEKDLFR
ncbi:MAG: coenzyme F420-0:L-glutamate ligase [Deltaproteobacteria bacterium]|nr:coenzyme F420-0:L-glutamate ligase [Deltaproteobacteria bacterium]MBT7203660.1 coenzyme F420-0:L-glutamate ligase [Deltaproteobacteria bacterium]